MKLEGADAQPLGMHVAGRCKVAGGMSEEADVLKTQFISRNRNFKKASGGCHEGPGHSQGNP